MAYKAPIWEDGKSPAISAENLNNLSQAAEGAQVLYGNSAPTSSTEGAVGQFYLVVVADSAGNYPLYQCVAIANGSYVWRDTRRIPDSITSMLGISAPGTINSALNVLANIGNVHVWAKSIKISEAIPESYKLEGEYTINLMGPYASSSATGTLDLSWTYASTVVVSNGSISMGPDKTTKQIATNKTGSLPSEIVGKFVEIDGIIYYCPSTATMNTRLAASYYTDIVGINGVVYVPAVSEGIHTDYLTSTDRSAYPDQSAEGGEPEIPAHYTLADAATVNVLSSAADYSASVYSCDLNSIIVNNDGSISKTGFGVLMSGNGALTSPGNWVKFSPTEAYYITSGSSNVVFTDTIFTVSAETTLQYVDGKYVLPGCRELIGHAKVEAIPPNTSITYLGQLGGGARIEVGSYVGTGTYGSGNKNTLTFKNKSPKKVTVVPKKHDENSQFVSGSFPFVNGATSAVARLYLGAYMSRNVNLSWSDDSVSWYSTDSADVQLNKKSETYFYAAEF